MSTLQLRSKWTMERRKFKTNYVSISKDTAQNSRPMEQILEINKDRHFTYLCATNN